MGNVSAIVATMAELVATVCPYLYYNPIPTSPPFQDIAPALNTSQLIPEGRSVTIGMEAVISTQLHALGSSVLSRMSFSSFCSPICLIPHKQNNRPNASIVVEFTRFDTEWSYDIVYVYDGTDFTTATNLGEYTGSQSTVEYIPKVRYIPVLLTFGLIKQQRLYRPRELS